MPGKQKVPAPIDRPLSRAYLRQFTGWSTAFPPGASEPTSLRIMENMMIDRNGSVSTRPGLRYLSYAKSPDMDPNYDKALGETLHPLKPIGSLEPFYVYGGSRAMLFAVREADQTVGFRALLFSGATKNVYTLTAPEIGFDIPQGAAALNFSKATTHVEYLQINNRIIALSNAGESIRMFWVGGKKLAKKMNGINVPEWSDGHKLTVVHPDASWINAQTGTVRRNECLNSSFEVGTTHWAPGTYTGLTITEAQTGLVGQRCLVMKSLPQRTNIQTAPLHDVETTGAVGWTTQNWGRPAINPDGNWMKVAVEAGMPGLFFADGARLYTNVTENQKYVVAVDMERSNFVDVYSVIKVTFYNTAGAKIGDSTIIENPNGYGRYVTGGITSPAGTTTMRVSLGGRSLTGVACWTRFKDVVVCKEGEPTSMFSGALGGNYAWSGPVNASASVYHPPVDVSITASRVVVGPSKPLSMSIYAGGTGVSRTGRLEMRQFSREANLVKSTTGTLAIPAAAWVQIANNAALTESNTVTSDFVFTIQGVARGEAFVVDAAMIEPGATVPGPYFDGGTPWGDAGTAVNSWESRGLPHECASIQTDAAVVTPIPTAEVPTAKTLVAAGGAVNNPYKTAFFYTFENELGESAASKITEIRTQRPMSNWFWERPNAAGEPDPGLSTTDPDLCADQLVAIIPQAVYNAAIAEGAIKWNLYVLSWSDQEPVPVVGLMSGERMIFSDEIAVLTGTALPYKDAGWISITPQRKIGINDAILPTATNRVNYSRPPRSRSGLVAGDRMILVGDPTELATVRWSSSRGGEYTNFTASRGGGAKTLTTGNLHIPASVVLWQNPQSVDTLAILCMGETGGSTSYYMAPAQVSAGSSGTTPVMGFEETTSTPGSMSPYGAQVLNNALYRPIERSLLKSTAQNYNINHKAMTDKIANMWSALRTKQWVMSAQLDQRLYYLVHNPRGALLEEGCRGNEIWVLDLGIESNPWSRFLIQGAALKTFEVGGRTFMGIVRPDGIFYLDPDYRQDDYVDDYVYNGTTKVVRQQPITWCMETNTQGANRAHDAWAHLQQLSVMLGDFVGTLRYGVRGIDLDGRPVNIIKQMTDLFPLNEQVLTWDVEDQLQVKKNMKEWYFFAESVENRQGTGRIVSIQYRYTPVSVNVGYEHGSVETFEYHSDVAYGNTSTDWQNARQAETVNGIPRGANDFRRP